MSNKGLLIVISGPSGCGKGTVCKAILEKNKNTKLSISATTRDMREGEEEGVSYFFKTKDEFEKMIAENAFLEYNCGYGGNYYGTPKKYVMDWLESGHDVILEIEMNGAMNVKKHYPDGVLVFLAPPSLDELYRRLVSRGRESAEQINARFSEAKEEMKRIEEYDYVVINDDFTTAVKKIESIIEAEKYAVKRNKNIIDEII